VLLLVTQNNQKLSAIPTNIITGFLGSGKTSAILHLLKQKPENECWAVLVNEFGEIGVDGSLLEGQKSHEQSVYIREVAGGCMCCTAGLPMHIALNQLLTLANPDRLLIEPTGLGHPLEILEVLTSEFYQDVIELHKVLTLVDARQLEDSRYTSHQTFNQQIAIADIIIGNKSDLYDEDHRNLLTSFVQNSKKKPAPIFFTEQGGIEVNWVNGPTNITTTAKTLRNLHKEVPGKALNDPPIPKCGFIKAINEGEGFYSVGWRFDPQKTFFRKSLLSFLSTIQAERIKAVFITNDGVFGYNLTKDNISEIQLDDCFESRIEIIAYSIDEQWDNQLFSCIASH